MWPDEGGRLVGGFQWTRTRSISRSLFSPDIIGTSGSLLRLLIGSEGLGLDVRLDLIVVLWSLKQREMTHEKGWVISLGEREKFH